MKVQFCFNTDPTNIVAEFDVAAVPTEKQYKAIEDEINYELDKWEEARGDDFADFDYWQVCRDAVDRHASLATNTVIRTFYI